MFQRRNAQEESTARTVCLLTKDFRYYASARLSVSQPDRADGRPATVHGLKLCAYMTPDKGNVPTTRREPAIIVVGMTHKVDTNLSILPVTLLSIRPFLPRLL